MCPLNLVCTGRYLLRSNFVCTPFRPTRVVFILSKPAKQSSLSPSEPSLLVQRNACPYGHLLRIVAVSSSSTKSASPYAVRHADRRTAASRMLLSPLAIGSSTLPTLFVFSAQNEAGTATVASSGPHSLIVHSDNFFLVMDLVIFRYRPNRALVTKLRFCLSHHTAAGKQPLRLRI